MAITVAEAEAHHRAEYDRYRKLAASERELVEEEHSVAYDEYSKRAEFHLEQLNQLTERPDKDGATVIEEFPG